MTIVFLMALCLLAAVGWLVLRLPLPAAGTDTTVARRAHLQASLAELARAHADGALDAASFADEQRRLQAELIHLPAAAVPVAAQAGGTGWPFALGVLVLLPAAGLGLYAYVQGPFWTTLDASQGDPQVGANAPIDPEAMVARLEARLAADGNDVEGWKRLGRSYTVLGRPGDARRAYGKAAQLAPDDLSILEAYAGLAEEGIPPPPGIAAVIERFEQAVRDAPEDPRLWVRAGFGRSARGDRAGARDAYARAHELDPQRPEVLAAYAASEYALNPQQPSTRAVQLYRQLLELNPGNGSALWVLGQAAQLAGRSDQAREYWQRLLQALRPDDPARGQVQRAIEQLTLAKPGDSAD